MTFGNSTHRLITHLIKFSKNLDRRCRIVCVSEAELGDATIMESKKGLAIFLLQLYAYSSIILCKCTEIVRPQNMERSCLVTRDFNPISAEIYPNANYSIQ